MWNPMTWIEVGGAFFYAAAALGAVSAGIGVFSLLVAIVARFLKRFGLLVRLFAVACMLLCLLPTVVGIVGMVLRQAEIAELAWDIPEGEREAFQDEGNERAQIPLVCGCVGSTGAVVLPILAFLVAPSSRQRKWEQFAADPDAD